MYFRILTLLFIIHVSLFYNFASSCKAYFSTISHSPSIKLITTHTDTKLALFSHYLVISDNDPHHQYFRSNSSEHKIQSSNFIFAFQIPLIEIVSHQIGAEAPLEFSIENLLYANLKLERLISEFISLKKRSRSILEGLEIPYLSNPGESERLLNQIRETENQIRFLAGPIISSFKTDDFIGRYDIRHNSLSNKVRQHSLVKQSPNNRSGTTYRNDINTYVGSEENTALPQETFDYNSGLDEHLPLIERIGRSLISYFKTHKIELIFCIIGILTLYHLFVRIRK